MTALPTLLSFTKKNTYDIDYVDSKGLYRFPTSVLASRLQFKPDLFRFAKGAESLAELLQSPDPGLTWEECCLKRAQDLLDLNRDHYYINYSGGIDSTNAVVSLLRVWPKEALKKVTIRLTHHCIDENPAFFDRYISRFHLQNSLLDVSSLLVKKNALLVTGELGDQLFGSDFLLDAASRFGDSCLNKNYQDFAPVLFAVPAREDVSRKMFEHLHPIVAESPFPIRTTHDFFWWYNFTQKWQYVKYRYPESVQWDLRAKYGSHIVHFFDSVEFQKWSLANHDLKIRDTVDSYKFTAKEHIYNFTKNPDDLNLKKSQSLAKTYVMDEKRIAITSNHTAVATIEELKPYVL
jgi:hypothetical protein